MFILKKLTRYSAIIFLFISFQASADRDISTSVKKGIEIGIYPVGIGSKIDLKSEDSALNGPAIFIGNTVFPDGSNSYQMYLSEKTKKIFYISPDYFKRLNSSKQQKVLDSYEQAGGTCSAYAINNFLQQTNLSGFKGTNELEKIVNNEEGRTWLLADAINEYYLTLSHKYSLNGIMNKYGKRFGFKCKKLQTESFAEVSQLLLSHLKIGSPVLVSYNIGPKMIDGPFPLEVYNQKNIKLDERLWIPRRTGERNSGGHSITAVGAFESNNKTYLVMIDSDWSEPRIWDLNEFLNHDKTALEEIEFITCK